MNKTANILENESIRLAVQIGGNHQTRNAASAALRRHRKEGNRERAQWLRNHLYWITGYLWKD